MNLITTLRRRGTYPRRPIPGAAQSRAPLSRDSREHAKQGELYRGPPTNHCRWTPGYRQAPVYRAFPQPLGTHSALLWQETSLTSFLVFYFLRSELVKKMAILAVWDLFTMPTKLLKRNGRPKVEEFKKSRSFNKLKQLGQCE